MKLKYLWFLVALLLAAWVLISCSAQLALKVRFDCPVSDLQLDMKTVQPPGVLSMQSRQQRINRQLPAPYTTFSEKRPSRVSQHERKSSSWPETPQDSPTGLLGPSHPHFADSL